MRHVLPHSQLPLSRDPQAAQPPAPVEAGAPTAVAEAPPERKEWFFVKNMNPREKLKFLDGETFIFPGQVFHTKDSILANKILAVAQRYRIVLQK